jgi:PBP1b-binding outer membrane lipoprotein LpoB
MKREATLALLLLVTAFVLVGCEGGNATDPKAEAAKKNEQAAPAAPKNKLPKEDQ